MNPYKAVLIKAHKRLVKQGVYPATATKILIKRTKLGYYPPQAMELLSPPSIFVETKQDRERRILRSK